MICHPLIWDYSLIYHQFDIQVSWVFAPVSDTPIYTSEQWVIKTVGGIPYSMACQKVQWFLCQCKFSWDLSDIPYSRMTIYFQAAYSIALRARPEENPQFDHKSIDIPIFPTTLHRNEDLECVRTLNSLNPGKILLLPWMGCSIVSSTPKANWCASQAWIFWKPEKCSPSAFQAINLCKTR